MSQLSNPLPAVYEVFRASQDALKVTEKALKSINRHNQDDVAHYQKSLLRGTVFYSSRTNSQLRNELTELDNLFVIALWATFERFLREYLQLKVHHLQTGVTPADLGDVLYKHCRKEIEYWKPDDILDFFKKSILKSNPNIVGSAKQIYVYRNDLAHGKNRQQLDERPIKIIVKPDWAYSVLNQITELLLLN